MKTLVREIQAVIGVWVRGGRTFYVKRSATMENYPGAWSLLSIQFGCEELPDFLDLGAVAPLIERMSEERLGGVPVGVARYLKSARCSDNPMKLPVELHLYEIELGAQPHLNPDYYVDCGWFTPEEYMAASGSRTCGLCMRMWSDYCYQNGLSEARFAPRVAEEDEE